jgi:ribosomal protein L4
LYVLCGAVLLCVVQPKDWSISMNKKERRLALATALQSAASDVVVVEDIKQAAGAHRVTRAASSSRTIMVSATGCWDSLC